MDVVRRFAVLAGAVVGVLAASGCDADRSGGERDHAGAYARVIEWFVERAEAAAPVDEDVDLDVDGTDVPASSGEQGDEQGGEHEGEEADEEEPVVVFIEERAEGVHIGLTMQAAIIARAEPFASVRFVDDREEALTDGDAPVRDDGVLLALGGANEHDDRVVIECDEFVALDEERSWRFELTDAGEDWVLEGEPEPLET